MITELERAYLAGFFDGEGCISIVEDGSGKNTYSPKMYLAMNIASCDKYILDYWADKTKIGKVNVGTKARGNARTGYQWQTTGQKAVDLLGLMYPYLNIKKAQADVAFKFQETVRISGKRTPPDVVQQRYIYKDELSKLKGTTKAGRPRIHDSRRPPALEMAALLTGEGGLARYPKTK